MLWDNPKELEFPVVRHPREKCWTHLILSQAKFLQLLQNHPITYTPTAYINTVTHHPTMALDATPRITARYLERFTHQTVRIVGKVTSLRGELATLEADGSVTISLNRVSHRISLNHPRFLYRRSSPPTFRSKAPLTLRLN